MSINSNSNDVPEAYLCALTKCVMTDPVIDTKGGYTFERTAIETWLKSNKGVCPMTRRPMQVSELVPNRALKDAIDQWHAKEQEAAEASLKERKEREDVAREVMPSAPGGPAGPVQPAAESKAAQVLPLGSALLTSVVGDGLTSTERSVLLKVTPPKGNHRTSVDLVCVIDTSYSMSEEATVQNAAGKKEMHGLSLLDVVKHATRMILEMSSDKDRVSLVSFSSQAKVVLPLTVMNKAGKKRALAALDLMKPDANTNLWDGLSTGLDVLRDRQHADMRAPAIALLTDGQPNVEPPRGHLAALQRYKETNPFAAGVTISTFGFGYNLDSKLLDVLAREGNGRFAFIPDSGFVGTIFVHCLANLLSSYAQQVVLNVEASNCEIAEVTGMPATTTSWGRKIELGTACFGQSRDVVLKLRNVQKVAAGTQLLTATLKYTEAQSMANREFSTVVSQPAGSAPKADLAELEIQTHRLEMVQQLAGDRDRNAGQKIVQQLMTTVSNSSTFKSHATVALYQDLKGQISEAHKREDYFQKWGRHFLLSLLRAHQLQECNNFKDPGVQVYGGQLFNKLRDEADDIFLKLAPPKPSIKRNNVVPVANMRTYHNRGGGCFTGECTVTMADGSTRRVDSLKKGDILKSGDGETAVRVACVLKTVASDGVMELVTLPGSGLRATPWHPVYLETAKGKREWVFPIHHGTLSWQPCDAVYTFLVDGASRPDQHSMIINGVTVVTLANGAKGDVREHDFFGTEKIVHAMRRSAGFHAGLVEVQSGCLIKHPETGLVCDLRI